MGEHLPAEALERPRTFSVDQLADGGKDGRCRRELGAWLLTSGLACENGRPGVFELTRARR